MGTWETLLLTYAVSLATIATPILGPWLLMGRRQRHQNEPIRDVPGSSGHGRSD